MFQPQECLTIAVQEEAAIQEVEELCKVDADDQLYDDGIFDEYYH